MTPGRTENGVKNRFNSLMKKWFKKHQYPATEQEDTIIGDLYKSLLASQSNPQEQKKHVDSDMSVSQHKHSNTKKTVCIDELKKKQDFNLLFELLKADLGTSNNVNSTLFSDQKKNIALIHQMDINDLEKSIKKEPIIIRKEEPVIKRENNATLYKARDIYGYQMNTMNMGISMNPAYNSIWMQQYMMNTMLQQAAFNNAMMANLLKHEQQ